jgi:hypothetical protein
MERKLMLKSRTLFAAGVLGFFGGVAQAQVASQFQGVWLSAPTTADQSSACKRSDWGRRDQAHGKIDGLINVTQRTIEHWESRCNVTAFRMVKPASGSDPIAEVALACGGEGERWNTRELWSVQSLASRKVLIQVQLQRAETTGGKQKAARLVADLAVSMYLQCQN